MNQQKNVINGHMWQVPQPWSSRCPKTSARAALCNLPRGSITIQEMIELACWQNIGCCVVFDKCETCSLSQHTTLQQMFKTSNLHYSAKPGKSINSESYGKHSKNLSVSLAP